MPISTVHNSTLPVIQMVYNRLTFVSESDPNNDLLSHFAQEAFHELEPCFRAAYYILAEGDTPPTGYENASVGDEVMDESRIADEQYYSVLQKSLIADIVTIYTLMQFAHGVSSTETTGEDETASTYIKKAKAGSVEIEYGTSSKGGTTEEQLKITVDNYLDRFKDQASRKSARLGCGPLSVCDECDGDTGNSSSTFPLMVQSHLDTE